ncbi:2'-5' RNA ligase family protein [Haloferax prahovense]|uniref:2'-5' RNA ligase family protein n=1 Tax=Haloferax prahovense TaxID=381852 RepID=UPI003C77FE94
MTEDSSASDYDAVWSQTQASDPVLLSGSFADQRARGLTEAYVCWVRIEDGAVLDALSSVRTELGSMPGVSLDDEDTLHVTLKLVGFGPSESGDGSDEVTPVELDTITRDLEAAAADTDPFEVSIRRLNAFPSVVFAEPHAGGRFRALHDRIRSLDGVPTFQYEGDEYVPHVSLAHFETAAGFERACSWIRGDREIRVPDTTVSSFELASVPLSEYEVEDIDVLRRVEL